MTGARLTELMASARRRAARLRKRRGEIEAAAATAVRAPDFAGALSGTDVAVIAEIKRRSPSAGTIAANLDPVAHALRYVTGGARAVSVLTDPDHFGGSTEDLSAVATAVPVPVVRKDFLLDPLQIYEARANGASAVLLIVRVLADSQLAELAGLAAKLGLARLVEVHAPGELDRALRVDPEAVGVNSRDLDTFRIDLPSIGPILSAVPSHVRAVAESGIQSRDDVERVATWGADAILVGTVLAGMSDPLAGVRTFTGVRRGERSRNAQPAPGGRS